MVAAQQADAQPAIVLRVFTAPAFVALAGFVVKKTTSHLYELAGAPAPAAARSRLSHAFAAPFIRVRI